MGRGNTANLRVKDDKSAIANEQVAEVGLLIYPACQMAAIYGLTDLFRIATEWSAHLGMSIRERYIRVSHWKVDVDTNTVSCVWDSHPEREHRLSHVILPPSVVIPEKMPLAPMIADWMKARHAEGVTVCSVCAGAFILAQTGLLSGRKVTTHWAFADLLASRFPEIELVTQDMVIDDGDVITAGGILAWTDLGLALVSKFMGSAVMVSTARFLLSDAPRENQLAFRTFAPKLDHGDAEILRAQHNIHAHPAHAHSILDLAARVHLTERTFMRRFGKATGLRPTEYLQQVRIMKAREALELTNQSVSEIAWSVGYSDPAAFRRLFKKVTGILPNNYRDRFRPR
ncbi:GlxA family transcriptional regulator [Comamonas humi]